MNNYKLIKFRFDNFIIISDEKNIKESIDVLYNDKIYKTVYSDTVPQGEILLSGFGYVLKSDCKKIIAGIDGLPKIDYNGFDNVVGYIDAIQIAEDIVTSHPDYQTEGKSDYQNGRFNGIIEGIEYILTYNNKDDKPKIFDIELEMVKATANALIGGYMPTPKISKNNKVKIILK